MQVSVRELLEAEGTGKGNAAFGDNDGLSARVGKLLVYFSKLRGRRDVLHWLSCCNVTHHAYAATAIDADLLVLLTDVDGVFNRNPVDDPTATRLSRLTISRLVEIDTESGASRSGTGGMGSKVDAATWACQHGVTTLIANGCGPALLIPVVDSVVHYSRPLGCHS